jgi:sigma54-dependent transcription regulator
MDKWQEYEKTKRILRQMEAEGKIDSDQYERSIQWAIQLLGL